MATNTGNPFYVEPLGGMGPQITQQLQGLGQTIAQKRKEDEALARAEESKAAVLEAYRSGDPDKMAEVAIQYPEVTQSMEKAFGFSSQATRPVVENTYSQVLADPDNAVEYLTQGIEQVQAKGGTPTNMLRDLQAFQRDPEAAYKMVQFGVASTAPKVWKAYQDIQKGGADLAKLDIDKEKLQMRKEESRVRQLEQQLGRETNDLKRQELQLKIDEKKQKLVKGEQDIAEAESKKQASYDMASEAAQIATELAEDPALDQIVGTAAIEYLPTIRGSSQDLVNKAMRLQSLLTVDNLKLMSGVLTDRDIAFLTNVASGLNVVEDKGIKGSLGGVRGRLNQIATKISKQLEGQTRPEVTIRVPQEQTQSIDDLVNKYGN